MKANAPVFAGYLLNKTIIMMYDIIHSQLWYRVECRRRRYCFRRPAMDNLIFIPDLGREASEFPSSCPRSSTTASFGVFSVTLSEMLSIFSDISSLSSFASGPDDSRPLGNPSSSLSTRSYVASNTCCNSSASIQTIDPSWLYVRALLNIRWKSLRNASIVLYAQVSMRRLICFRQIGRAMSTW